MITMVETLGYFSAALAVVVILVNIITQVVKGFTYDKIPTRVVAFITAIVLCVAAVYVYCAVKSIPVAWYYVVGAIVGGFVAAYGAMYGYDNLYGELGKAIKNLLGGGKNGVQ